MYIFWKMIYNEYIRPYFYRTLFLRFSQVTPGPPRASWSTFRQKVFPIQFNFWLIFLFMSHECIVFGTTFLLVSYALRFIFFLFSFFASIL